MVAHPILWSFRRCPYAMRARLALWSAGIRVELREIVLRDKPEAFLDASPSATVPALVLPDRVLPDRVLDESRDIMIWALQQHDPEQLLAMPDAGWGLIDRADGPFKQDLDHTKYAVRYPDLAPEVAREQAADFLRHLETQLGQQRWLFGDRASVADLAILPFVRQFAGIDRAWFDAQDWPALIAWLHRFTQSDSFAQIMTKYAPWAKGDAPVWFGTSG